MKPGPKPTSAKVHYLHGNPSKLPASRLLDEFSPDVALPKCPPHLKGPAAAEYKRLGAELERYGLMSELDRGVLAMMATEWSRHVWAEKRIAEINAADPEGERGLVDKTPNGYQVQSVYLQISRKAIEIYHRLALEYGLTPAARTRVPPPAMQIPLPGIEQPNQAAAGGKPTLSSFA